MEKFPALNQEPDRYSLTFNIPRALIPIPILSWQERFLVAGLTLLSNKYTTKNKHTISNKNLAYRQQCAANTVSSALSKADWLGIIQSAEITKDIKEIEINIPEIWKYFGELWADFYFKGDETAHRILKQMRTFVYKEYKKHIETRSTGKIDLQQLLEMTSKDIQRILQAPKQLPDITTSSIENKTYLPIAKYLARIVETKNKIKFTDSQINQWTDEIQILVESNGIKLTRIETALKWYAKHIGKQYIPVIESGADLRNKFIKLENAIEREKSREKNNTRINGCSKPSPGKYDGLEKTIKL